MPEERSTKRSFLGQLMINRPRKVALCAGLAAILTLMVGAGFANMSASGSATPLETTFVRWIAVGFLAIGVAAYVRGGHIEKRDSH